MTTHDALRHWHELHDLEARYWYDVDLNGGRNAHEFFLPDGLMVVGLVVLYAILLLLLNLIVDLTYSLLDPRVRYE